MARLFPLYIPSTTVRKERRRTDHSVIQWKTENSENMNYNATVLWQLCSSEWDKASSLSAAEEHSAHPPKVCLWS